MWIRMGGGSSKPKIKDVLEYLKQTAGWTKEDSSFGGTSGTSISYGNETVFTGEYISAGYSYFRSNTINVKNAKKLIASYNWNSLAGAMSGAFAVINADTNTVIYNTNKESFVNKEIDITYVDNLKIRIYMGNTGISNYYRGTMTVSKLMLE